MSNIRVTYSGLLSLLVSLVGVITGTIFVIIVTRKLTPEELGSWTLITTVVSYVLIVDPIISYWSTRQIARGEEVGKTALFTGSMFTMGGIIVYLVIALFFSNSLKIDSNALILATILIPLMFLHSILSAIAFGYKPHVEQYGIMSFEITKIPIGVFLVINLQLGIIGAILTIIVANSVRVLILILMLKEKLWGKFKKEVLKFWLKMSWLPMYGAMPGLIMTFDVLIFSNFAHSLKGLAYWTAGLTIAALVTQSGNISQALYPKIIATGKKEIAEENIRKTMLFAIPFLALSLIFAKPLLYIINPLYVDGVLIVYFLSLKSFVAVLNNIAFGILRAYDRVDLDKNATFKEYVKSKLFFIPTLQYIMSIAYIIGLSLFLILRPIELNHAVDLVMFWSMIYFVVYIPFTIYGIISMRRNHRIVLPYTSIIKFALVSLGISFLLLIMKDRILTYPKSIWEFMPQILPMVILGGLLYFGISYLIDKSVKSFFNSIIAEIRKSFNL